MSSRDLVPCGHGRKTTRDLVSYENVRVSIRPPQESTRDSRAHETTARGQTSHCDHYPSECESARSRPESTWDFSQTIVQGLRSHCDSAILRHQRESTWDSGQTIVRGQTSHHDHYPSEHESLHSQGESTRDSSQPTIRGQPSHCDPYPSGSRIISIRPGRESTQDSRSHQTTTNPHTSPQGHSPHQTSARRDSRANTKHSVPKGAAERSWQLDEAYYKNDGKTITQRARFSNLAGNSTEELEIRDTPTSLTLIRHRVTHRSHRSPDVQSKNDTSRNHNPDRSGGSRNPTATGSTRRNTLTSSRDTPHRTAGGPSYDEPIRCHRR